MIKKLRQKFILSAMLSLVLVLFVILSGIHIMNYNKITSDADNILTVLNQYEVNFRNIIHLNENSEILFLRKLPISQDILLCPLIQTVQ